MPYPAVTRERRGLIALLLLIFLVGLHSTGAAEAKIRLRNEVIQPGRTRDERSEAEATSGLFLVQVKGQDAGPWRQQLEGMGVEVIRYIPDETYLVRLSNGGPGRLRTLPFVRWVGKYRPEHKLDQRLAARLAPGGGGVGAPMAPMSINILLRPRATPTQFGEVRRSMARVGTESRLRFGTVLRGDVTPAQLAALMESEAVLWLEPAPKMQLFDEIATKIVAGDDAQGGTPAEVHARGYDGRGVTVAVADSGLHNGDAESMHPDLFGRVTGFFYYNTLEDASDEHGHGTHVAGIVGGNAAVGEVDETGAFFGLGVAPGVNIIAQRIFDGLGGYEPPPSFETLTRHAVRGGAEIGSNSWGDDTQGRYDLSAAEFDALVRDADALTPGDQPYILEFSAGNAGPGLRTIGSPAVAKNVIATGASQNNRFEFFYYAEGQDAMADFSSRGPCEDGRIKPDVVAPGTWIASLQSDSATDENAWAAISGSYQYQGGTSQAGPHVSGAAAVFVQFYRETHGGTTPSPALVKAALINSAVDMDDSIETDPAPNFDEGWGRIDLEQLLLAPDRRHEYIDQTEWLAHGQMFERQIVVARADVPLHITLVYTDVPGFPGALRALVNDLDLEVIGPDGRSYHGNHFEEGESVPNAPGFDEINNVEGVRLEQPVPGEYRVRVHARSINEDALQASAAVDQDFALAVSGDIPFPGVGAVVFDHGAYRAPGQIRLTLVDQDLAGQSVFPIVLRSTTESAGEVYTLRASGASGSFTGTVATVTGAALADGRLQISHGDLIEAIYQDTSPADERISVARADFEGPEVFGVEVFDRFGRSVVGFETDEPTRTVVYFGPTPSLGRSTTNSFFRESHAVALADLLPEQTYYFMVVATDAAGNTTTNDNDGLLYSFVVPPVPTVLLVDDYTDFLFEVPPLTGYTDALEAAGISYVTWVVEEEGASPTLDDMRPFPVVIWRLPEFVDTFSPLEQQNITNYLAGGGSLLVASMEALSRLDEAGSSDFRINTLHVDDFTIDAGVSSVVGQPGDPSTAGLAFDLDYTMYEDEFKELLNLPADVSDTLVPGPDADPILLDQSTGEVVGLRYPRVGQDSPGRLVFLSFPLDAIPLDNPAPNNRAAFLGQLLSFLTPLDDAARLVLDRPFYSIPSQAVVEVTDRDRSGQGQISAVIMSGFDPVGRTIVLKETVRRGVFRGAITLKAAAGPVGSDELGVNEGDQVQVTYIDISAGNTLTTEAIVETVPPEITNVTDEADYVEATVFYNTSEPSETLVQYGESPLLGRTAHDGRFVTTHAIQLTGLQPNRLYYYQVVSRDRAGNTSVDTNSGALYTFQTLLPLTPSWQDTLEAGEGEWQVYTDESEGGWKLGPPAAGHGITPVSGQNVWGSNLDRESTGFVESFLVSPPIHLVGGNKITVRWWENYDFFGAEGDVFEFGEFLLITNSVTPALSLGFTDEISDGWQQTEVDVSEHAGRVVYLAWHYVLFSFEDRPRTGWMLDDIEVTATTVEPGTIFIYNNLSQASYALAGPTSRAGLGFGLELTNASPGDYDITFGDVPFYSTPPSQSGTLVAGGTLIFDGTYTFADGNSNGISDLWEQSFFNEVSPSRSSATDTDADGMSDGAEFLSGTDPTVAASKLRIASATRFADGSVRIEWSGAVGRSYRVESSPNAIAWTPVSDWLRVANNSVQRFTVPATATDTLFFRVAALP